MIIKTYQGPVNTQVLVVNLMVQCLIKFSWKFRFVRRWNKGQWVKLNYQNDWMKLKGWCRIDHSIAYKLRQECGVVILAMEEWK